MKHDTPPSWADRFLSWYCNPDLLEEIQGDLLELYRERIETEGRRKAKWKYVYDVIRFLRWSNIRRSSPRTTYQLATIWAFNLKVASRNVRRNKLIFALKAAALSLCLTFSLLIAAFILNEVTFDEFHENSGRIFRVTSKVKFQDRTTHYAVTPLPIGEHIAGAIPEVQAFTRFLYTGKPVYRIDDAEFHNEVTLTADKSFLKIFTFGLICGDPNGLDGADKIVLTKSLASKFFKNRDPIGKVVEISGGHELQVSAVINDPPRNSHLKFDALISWDSFEQHDEWGNINAYTYLLLQPQSVIETVTGKMAGVLGTFHDLVAREYDAVFEPQFENVTNIHFSPSLDEDIAVKRNMDYLWLLAAVVFIFLISGIINYLNLSLAEITAGLKKIGIIRIFGGSAGNHNKIVISDALVTTLVVGPVTVIFFHLALKLSSSRLSISIEPSVFSSPGFIGLVCGFLVMLLLSSQINAIIVSRVGSSTQLLKGRFTADTGSAHVRKALLIVQLAFSITMVALIMVVSDQFRFIHQADKGFNDKNTVVIKLRDTGYSRTEAFNDRLKNVSGISGVGASSYYPGIIETKYVFEVERENGMQQRLLPMMVCSYDYFHVLGIKLGGGRGFDQSHGEDPFNAFVINETAAREFGWTNPIGKRISGPFDGGDGFYREGKVIGVVRDFNFASLHTPIEPMIMFLASDDWAANYLYIKTDPIHRPDLIGTIEQQYKAVWPNLPFDWEYLDSKYLSLYNADHGIRRVFETGLTVSVFITCLGVFGISALMAALRLREMGIRKVLGAPVAQLFLLHSIAFVRYLIISMLLAIPFINILSRQWLRTFAYHVELGIQHFLVPGGLALISVLTISGYHAFRNARVRPVDVLRRE